jgi:hypothetical protein
MQGTAGESTRQRGDEVHDDHHPQAHASLGRRERRGPPWRRSIAVAFLLLATASCTEEYSFCRDFLEYLLDEEYGATPEYLSVALVITFEPETPPDVIDAVVARCGGRIRPGHTPHYVCVGFDDRETALRAAACYDFASEVAVCLPNEYLSLDE